jgi:sulfur-carrier protein
MTVNIIIFGQLRDVLGEQLALNDVSDMAGLKKRLHEQYPAMTDTNYMVAVNKKLVTENTGLTENCTVAILSPFSGG